MAAFGILWAQVQSLYKSAQYLYRLVKIVPNKLNIDDFKICFVLKWIVITTSTYKFHNTTFGPKLPQWTQVPRSSGMLKYCFTHC